MKAETTTITASSHQKYILLFHMINYFYLVVRSKMVTCDKDTYICVMCLKLLNGSWIRSLSS